MRGTVAALSVALMAYASGCGTSSPGSNTQPPPPGAAVIVNIHNVAFDPQTVPVHAGEAVAWQFNDGTIAHNVTGSDWSSPDQTSGYYSHMFSTPGTYAYRCTIHSNMTGQVVVTP